MTKTEHFDLNIVEGTDIVNPLIQTNPNFEAIDNQMFANQNASIQSATELKNGKVHNITRLVADSPYITFTATSDFVAGETFTVDGKQVTALTVSGEALPTGAYVINSQVFCILKGTLLTIYGVGSEVADNSLALDGHPADYFGTAEDVKTALDTANAVKTIVDNSEGDVLFLNYTPEAFYNGSFLKIENLTQYKYLDIFFEKDVRVTSTEIGHIKAVPNSFGWLNYIESDNQNGVVMYMRRILLQGDLQLYPSITFGIGMTAPNFVISSPSEKYCVPVAVIGHKTW